MENNENPKTGQTHAEKVDAAIREVLRVSQGLLRRLAEK